MLTNDLTTLTLDRRPNEGESECQLDRSGGSLSGVLLFHAPIELINKDSDHFHASFNGYESYQEICAILTGQMYLSRSTL